MRKIEFVEETLRDGQLSLWATRMRGESMAGIAETLDNAGFRKACVASGAAFDTAVMFLYEDIWERLRLLRHLMPKTPLQFLIRGRNLLGWRRFPNDVVDLSMRCIKKLGFRWVMVLDGLNDIRNVEWHIKVAKDVGLKVLGVVFFSVSPVHTDEYFVLKAREYARLGVDAFSFYDASSVLTPDRACALFPLLRQAIGNNIEFEFNAHCSTGLASDCYVEAMRGGVDCISTASLPLAYGGSIPSTIDMMREAEKLGLEVSLDESLVRTIDEYFCWVAYQDRKPEGRPVPFDDVEYRKYVAHQIPGGMMSNFIRQLTDTGQLHRLPEILNEVARVRAELGYPPMVTPYSQLVGVQATLNVSEGRRYHSVPEELRLYVRGYYGETPAPIDADVRDRILAGKERGPIDPSEIFEERFVDKVRMERGPFSSDEDLLLAIFYDSATLDRYYKRKQVIDFGSVPTTPVSALIKEVSKRRDLVSVRVQKGALDLEVKGGAG